MEEELKLERDVRYRQEKELTNLRIDFDEIEQQLDEVSNARDREAEANKRFVYQPFLLLLVLMRFVRLV